MDLLDEKTADAAPADAAPATRAGGDKTAGSPPAAADSKAPAAASDGGKKAAPAKPAAAAAAAKGEDGARKAADAGDSDDADDDESADDGEDLGFSDDDDKAAPATWPDDWRQKLASGDEKWLKELGRYTSFENWAKAQRALRQKMSSGEYRRAKPGDDATDEEKAAWRKENGVPDKADDYGLPEVKGHQWSDADKAVANSFLADMHAAGTPKDIAHKALGWYAGLQQRTAEHRADLDRTDAETREDALRAEWGPADYRPNIKLARQMLNDDEFISPGLRQALAAARTPDGHRLLLHPDLTRFLAERGIEKRGPGSLISGEQGSRMTSRIEEIRRIMREDNHRYYAEGLDRELIDLLDKTESMQR